MENRAVIITGGGGFVGRHLIAELQSSKEFDRIVVFDRNIGNFGQGIESYEVDITDIESKKDLIQEIQPAWVIHLAAIAGVGFSIEHPDITRTVNVFGTKSLLEITASVSPTTKFLVISSADIYGAVSSDPLSELPLSSAHPRNPYAESKLEMEALIEEEFNDRCIRVRPFPHVGPGQQKGFVTADFASQIAAIEAGTAGPVISVGNLTAVRDFSDVRDVVRAYRLLLEHGALGEAYHVASGVGRSIESVLKLLLAMSRVSIIMKQDSSRIRPSDTPVVVGNTEKLKAATGWNTAIPFEQTLTDVLNDWRNRV
jgi:GDP-4-dehydro-6-deoxy-D-mannose reductase